VGVKGVGRLWWGWGGGGVGKCAGVAWWGNAAGGGGGGRGVRVKACTNHANLNVCKMHEWRDEEKKNAKPDVECKQVDIRQNKQ